MPWIAAGGAVLGGLLGGASASSAARSQAQAQTEAARIAAEEARFRPVGITTRFGRSTFEYGPEGRVTGAGYEVSPELKAYQDRLMALSAQGLTQAEGAQAAYQPLMGAAGGLFSLGQQYLAESPQQAAQKYMASQQELLAPSRERQMAQLQTQLFNTGRGGLSVGATGARPSGAAGLGATTPELEAYYNAIAQQDAQLAAQAQQAGQQQAAFGAGLFGTGANLLTQGYQGQVQALAPYQAYLSGVGALETLGQQPLDLGAQLGGRVANPYGAQAMLAGGVRAAESNYAANAYNPFATALTMASQNPSFGTAVRSAWSGSAPSSFDSTGYVPGWGVEY